MGGTVGGRWALKMLRLMADWQKQGSLRSTERESMDEKDLNGSKNHVNNGIS
jgi:hypothetical protein